MRPLLSILSGIGFGTVMVAIFFNALSTNSLIILGVVSSGIATSILYNISFFSKRG